MIEQIKKEMGWYGFELTTEQVQEFLSEHEIECFDTIERSIFLIYLSKKITGQYWPSNGASEDYKNKFYAALKENAPKFGYKWG